MAPLQAATPYRDSSEIFGRLMLREIALLGTSTQVPVARTESGKAQKAFSGSTLCHSFQAGVLRYRFVSRHQASHPPELYDRGTVGAYENAYSKMTAQPGVVFVSKASQLAFPGRDSARTFVSSGPFLVRAYR